MTFCETLWPIDSTRNGRYIQYAAPRLADNCPVMDGLLTLDDWVNSPNIDDWANLELLHRTIEDGFDQATAPED